MDYSVCFISITLLKGWGYHYMSLTLFFCRSVLYIIKIFVMVVIGYEWFTFNLIPRFSSSLAKSWDIVVRHRFDDLSVSALGGRYSSSAFLSLVKQQHEKFPMWCGRSILPTGCVGPLIRPKAPCTILAFNHSNGDLTHFCFFTHKMIWIAWL